MCDSTVISPDYLRGFDRKKGLIANAFVLMTVAYYLALIPGSYLKPAAEFCVEREIDCKRPELFAFEFVCASCFLWLAFISIRSWHIRKTHTKVFPDNAFGRVFGYSKESENIAAVSLTFQFWDLVATPFIPEFSSAIMLGHHICAALVSYVALQNQYYHYYVTFFFALSEVSSVPLVIMSLCKYFPPEPGSMQATMEQIATPIFAITFGYYRVYLWIQVTYQMWCDGLLVLSNGAANKYRPGKSFSLYLILGISAFLTLLQLFWFSLILAEVLKQIGIDIPTLNPGFE